MGGFDVVEGDYPVDVVDRLLWQDAQRILRRHASVDLAGNCVWCGAEWPCQPRRLAEQAEVTSRLPHQKVRPVTVNSPSGDLYAPGPVPRARGTLYGGGQWRKRNRGTFEYD